MVELGMITQPQANAALNEQLVYERYKMLIDQNSLYVAEMARQTLYEKIWRRCLHTRSESLYHC